MDLLRRRTQHNVLSVCRTNEETNLRTQLNGEFTRTPQRVLRLCPSVYDVHARATDGRVHGVRA